MDTKKINLHDQILSFLRESNSPMNLESISDYVNHSQSSTEKALDELIMGGHVFKIFPQNSNIVRRAYYTNAEYKIKDLKTENKDKVDVIANIDGKIDMRTEIAQEVVDAKDNYIDLKEKVEYIDKNVNGLYANIISIISIFVAIFALITVNANIAFTLTEKNMCGVFRGIIVINLFVVICILFLLIGVRLIIINPLIRKK